MKRSVVVALLILLASLVAVSQNQDKQQAAEQAATRWLGLVDAGAYDQSWDEASSTFKSAVTKENWHRMLDSIRGPLGLVQSRHVVTSTYQTELPGAPDGEYVVVRYQGSFEHKRSAVETVTMALDKDKWRAAGYFIK